MLVSDYIVERLIRLGVLHVFGVGGANIEDMFSAVQRRRPAIRTVLGKHEHGAGTAADAYARVRGFGVVMTTSGGGAMNLVHALAEARSSRVPMLAVVGEPPSSMQGRGAFQDTSGRGNTVDAELVFRAAAGRCHRLDRPSALPDLLETALRDARGATPGPVVILMAKEKQRADIDVADIAPSSSSAPVPPRSEELSRAARWLAEGPCLVVAGADIARGRACSALATLVARWNATVAVTPDGRDAFDNYDPRFTGVTGATGHSAVTRAAENARLIVTVGTRLPVLAREGIEEHLASKRLLSIGPERPFVEARESLHLAGETASILAALAGPPIASTGAPRAAPQRAAKLTMASALATVDRAVPDDAVVLVDAGNTGASAIHHLHAPRGGRWLVAMGMAGMGWAFGAATGAALASGKRCFVIAGDGAFFMNGMEIHTAVEHALPITYVVMNNRAHGMCLVRERVLLGEHAGYNAFRASHIGAGVTRMLPTLSGGDCTTLDELEARLAEAAAAKGPALVAVELDDVEVPPFTPFLARTSAAAVAREVDHD
jgi:acetolactate synthase-1/2/3 large subunit